MWPFHDLFRLNGLRYTSIPVFLRTTFFFIFFFSELQVANSYDRVREFWRAQQVLQIFFFFFYLWCVWLAVWLLKRAVLPPRLFTHPLYYRFLYLHVLYFLVLYDLFDMKLAEIVKSKSICSQQQLAEHQEVASRVDKFLRLTWIRTTKQSPYVASQIFLRVDSVIPMATAVRP